VFLFEQEDLNDGSWRCNPARFFAIFTLHKQIRVNINMGKGN